LCVMAHDQGRWCSGSGDSLDDGRKAQRRSLGNVAHHRGARGPAMTKSWLHTRKGILVYNLNDPSRVKPDQWLRFLRSAEWTKRICPKQLSDHPFCAYHLHEGRPVPATDVGHLDYPIFKPMLRSRSNLVSLCARCHRTNDMRLRLEGHLPDDRWFK